MNSLQLFTLKFSKMSFGCAQGEIIHNFSREKQTDAKTGQRIAGPFPIQTIQTIRQRQGRSGFAPHQGWVEFQVR